MRMQSLKAWGQGDGAPAHRQLIQGPLGQSVRESRNPIITDPVAVEVETLKLREGLALNRLSESGEACVADLVAAELKQLRMADQTNVLSQESAHVESQGMGTRQWGASAPSSGPGPRSQLL